MKKIVVRVQPNSREAKVEKIEKTNQHEPDYKVFLTASPQKGQANAELIGILADYFAKPKSKIFIDQGQTNKTKLIAIY